MGWLDRMGAGAVMARVGMGGAGMDRRRFLRKKQREKNPRCFVAKGKI